jgi:hypothetical protein
MWEQVVGERLYGDTDAYHQLHEAHEQRHGMIRGGVSEPAVLESVCELIIDNLQQLRAECELRHQRAA